jgi:N-formylglutamate amidohydrolase
MSLPLVISVPHAGIQVPPEVEELNLLTIGQITMDGDEGAREIFDIRSEVAAFVTTEIARAYLDVNRPKDDHGSDGVVKRETIYREPVYSRLLREDEISRLLSRYYSPYHHSLSRAAGGALLGVDCHTMAEVAPSIRHDAGTVRPHICLSNAEWTCSEEWTELMARCLEFEFGHPVSINDPFKGGHIIRSHAAEIPWLQLELSRAPFASLPKKRASVLRAFDRWCEEIAGGRGP